MNTLASAFPKLVVELIDLLSSENCKEIIPQVESGVIARCTFDRKENVGYLYIHRVDPSPGFSENITFFEERGILLDIDKNKNLMGIEILHRNDFAESFRKLLHFFLGDELCMGNINEVRQLLEQGADVNYRDRCDGFTPLITAAHTGQPDAVRLLFQHNADPDIRNREGRTAREVAERLGRHEALEVFDEFDIA